MSPSSVEICELQSHVFLSPEEALSLGSSLSQGYYDTMDAGFVDEENFLYIMSRSDDVINVAGHRLSSGALEEVRGNSECVFSPAFFFLSVFYVVPDCVLQVVLQHSAVGDCAVVGLDDSLKGVVPLALCVLRNSKLHQVAPKPGTATSADARHASLSFRDFVRSRSAENRG